MISDRNGPAAARWQFKNTGWKRTDVRKVLLTTTALAALAASWFCLRYLPAPFIWLACIWLAASITGAISAYSSALRMVFANLAAVAFAFGSFEAYLWLGDDAGKHSRFGGTYTEDYFRAHEVFGYGPARDTVVNAEKYYGDELIYSAASAQLQQLFSKTPQNSGECSIFATFLAKN